jgi:hypothetical protein
MKALFIHYTPTLEIQLTGLELQVLIRCSELHYDMVCKQASGRADVKHGRTNGFLRCMQMHYESAHTCTHIITFRQLDTLNKIIENPPMHQFSERLKHAASALFMKLGQCNALFRDNVVESKPVKLP